MSIAEKQALIIDSFGMEPQPVTMEGAKDSTIRELITDRDGAPNFAMRLFEISPGGHTPRHSHPHEHELYVLEGSGELRGGDEPRPLKAGDSIFVPGGVEHQFCNTAADTLKMLCLIPNLSKCC